MWSIYLNGHLEATVSDENLSQALDEFLEETKQDSWFEDEEAKEIYINTLETSDEFN